MNSLLKLLKSTAFILILASCSKTESLDNPRRGSVTIAADESFKPLIDQLASAYQGIYPEARFNINYKPEQHTILQLLHDSARLAFTTRKLTKKESSIIKNQQGIIQYQHIAIDGLAVVVSKSNSDSLMTLSELRSIFEGKITDWSQLPGSNQKGLITLVFDDVNASNLNYIREKFKITDLGKLRIIAAGSNEKVINDVKVNPLYMGFVGVNWISDGHSVISAKLSKGLTVFGISKSDNPKDVSEYYQPFQSGLELRKYPLSRDVYIISREGYAGLGGGLMTYIARDVGGLIIQKVGLIPMIRFPRNIEVRTGKNF